MEKTPEERIGITENDIETLKDSDVKQWATIEKLRNRLPIWATTLISLLTFSIGCTITYSVMLAKTVK